MNFKSPALIGVSLLFMLPLTICGQNAAKRPIGVPAEAKYFNGSWYRVFADKVDWKRARQKCGQAGGRLATIPDEATWAFIKSLTSSNVWLGATDEKLEGEWIDISGKKMSCFAWAPEQPNNRNGKDHYLSMIKKQMHDYHNNWDAIAATPIVGYVCEWLAK